MENKYIQTDLEYRRIDRGIDEDYFIETESYPIDLELESPLLSRIQFPRSRAILVRTSPSKSSVTIHIMRDVDLYSSFANFEIVLEGKKLEIMKEEGYIKMTIKVIY